MAEPKRQPESIEEMRHNLVGADYLECIRQDRCIPPPIGCGGPALPDSFRDALSRKEYSMSGLCQACQDRFFGAPEAD